MAKNEALIQWRKRKGLNQADAGEKLSASRETIIRWENCKPPIPLNKLDHVATVTGLPFEQLRPDLYAHLVNGDGEAA